jgi:hypothetical protein
MGVQGRGGGGGGGGGGERAQRRRRRLVALEVGHGCLKVPAFGTMLGNISLVNQKKGLYDPKSSLKREW